MLHTQLPHLRSAAGGPQLAKGIPDAAGDRS